VGFIYSTPHAIDMIRSKRRKNKSLPHKKIWLGGGGGALQNNGKLIVFLILLLSLFMIIFFSYSRANFKKQSEVGKVDFKVGELNYKIESDSLINNQITVDVSESVMFDITITSLNDISSKYELYYNVDSDDVTVGYLTTTVDSVVGETAKNEIKTIKVKIMNNSSASQTITFGVEGGLPTSELILTKGKKLVELEDGIPVSKKAFISENLGENCKTYNDGTDTFLVGRCKQNYVWYSGKLWRIVLKNNETGAVKLITDNLMTAIQYTTGYGACFEDSYVPQWLNQEFLPTLHDPEEFLVMNSIWDVGYNASKTPTRPNGTIVVNRTVGLLNSYEYYTTYNNSNGLATASTGYLNNGQVYSTLNCHSTAYVNAVISTGGLIPNSSSGIPMGVRPAVNLKSNIQIKSGIGTRENPYKLLDDEKETHNGATLISTRYSGEYLRFNNELYRIVGIENNLTKITAVDKPVGLATTKFIYTNFVNSIGTKLESYYQNNIIESYRNMIEKDTVWYLGTVGREVNYKASICKDIDATIGTKDCIKTEEIAVATIGLPRVGEIFTCQITRGTRAGFWTLTPYTTNQMNCVHASAPLFQDLTRVMDVHPSMYLKSNVVIAKDNTGDGTYEHPYDIELGT